MALSWIEVRQLEELMQPGGPVESGAAVLFPPRPAWMAEGSCRDPHPDANWFATAGAAHEAAISVCAGCPARQACGDFAMADPELVGDLGWHDGC